LARFFEDEDPAALIVSGSVLVIRDGRRIRRSLHVAFPTLVNKEIDRTLTMSARCTQAEGEDSGVDFEVTIPLTPASDSAAPGFAAGTSAGLV